MHFNARVHAAPRRSSLTKYGAPLVAAVTLLILTAASPGAQRRGNDNTSQGAPVATNTILQNPDAYYGKPVTMSAAVEQVLSRTAFLVDQRKAVSAKEVKAIGQPILVIAPYLTGALDEKNYLLMRGEIVKFDPAALARVAAGYTLDLAPDVGAKYQGQPVLVATSVIDSRYTELAKKPIPPPRGEEVSMTTLMKTINPAFAALRTAVQESKADVVTLNVATLKPAFTETETIWDGLGQSAAAEYAREARAHAASIEAAAAAGDWDAVKASAGALNQMCQNCHGAYRERQDDGTFRFKPGSF
jgi:cytochrome c556